MSPWIFFSNESQILNMYQIMAIDIWSVFGCSQLVRRNYDKAHANRRFQMGKNIFKRAS